MQARSNLITQQELESVRADSWTCDSYPAYQSDKLSIDGNVLIFENFNEEANVIYIKIFLLILDTKTKKGFIEFLGDMRWSSHVLDIQMDTLNTLISGSINEYLTTKYMGSVLDNAEEKHDLIDIDCDAVSKLYDNEEEDLQES